MSNKNTKPISESLSIEQVINQMKIFSKSMPVEIEIDGQRVPCVSVELAGDSGALVLIAKK